MHLEQYLSNGSTDVIKYSLVCPCTTNLMLLYNIVMISLAHIEDLFPTERPYALFYYHPSFATLRTKCNIVQLCINTKSPNNWVICAMFGNMVLGICSYFRPHMFNDLCLPSFLIYMWKMLSNVRLGLRFAKLLGP